MENVKQSKRKAGRPANTVKREIRTAIRFTHAEYFIVKEKAANAGLKPSAYIRWTSIHTMVKTRLSDEERQLVRQLIGMANNLNQIAKTAHREGMFKAMLYFEEYRNVFDDLLNKLRYGK